MARHTGLVGTPHGTLAWDSGILEAAGTLLTAGHGEGGKMSEHVVNDLDKLKGIGPRYKEMLKSIGVDSIKELRHRNPAHLKR